MADMGVSPGQRMTRRRAMGRRIIRKSAELTLMSTDLMAQDLEHLDAKERAKFDKLMKQVRVVAQHLDAMGTAMDSE